MRPAKAPIAIPVPAPKYGAHSVQILERLGYAREEIDSLLARKVVGNRWSDKYLPE